MRPTLLRSGLALVASLALVSTAGCYTRVRNTPPAYGGGPTTIVEHEHDQPVVQQPATVVNNPPAVVGGGPTVNVNTDSGRRHHDRDVRIEHDDD